MKRLASIDIGSQTIRLLVADVSPDGRLLTVVRNHTVIRLAEGMSDDGYLKNQPIERAVSCIVHYIKQAEKLQAEYIYAVATACVRAAKNSSFFLNAVFKKTGVLPTILTGHEEALMALEGVTSVIQVADDPTIVLDIGGGSTELVWLHNKKIIKTESIPLGVIGFTEQFLVHDPPSAFDIRQLRHSIKTILKKHGLLEDKSSSQKKNLVGTAGTVTTLAAMDLNMTRYDCDKINGHILKLKGIKKILEVMLTKNSSDRSCMPGLEPDRSTVIIAGTLIVVEIMNALTVKTLLVSDAGLLEGVLLQKIRS